MTKETRDDHWLIITLPVLLNLGDIAPSGRSGRAGGRKNGGGGRGDRGVMEQWSNILLHLCAWSVRILWDQKSVGRISHEETPPHTLPMPLFTSLKTVWLQPRGFCQGGDRATPLRWATTGKRSTTDPFSMMIQAFCIICPLWSYRLEWLLVDGDIFHSFLKVGFIFASNLVKSVTRSVIGQISNSVCDWSSHPRCTDTWKICWEFLLSIQVLSPDLITLISSIYLLSIDDMILGIVDSLLVCGLRSWTSNFQPTRRIEPYYTNYTVTTFSWLLTWTVFYTIPKSPLLCKYMT